MGCGADSNEIEVDIFGKYMRYVLLESPCECCIEPPGFINHGVSL